MPIQPVGPQFTQFSDGASSPPPPPPAPAEPVGYAVITTSAVNLRQAPVVDPNETPVLMPHDAVLEVLGEPNEDGWSQVRYNGIEGYAFLGGTDPDGTPYSESIPAEDYLAFEEARELYIHQLDAEQEFENAGTKNANCGPASLTMAFEREGLTLPEIPGVDNDGSDGSNVQRARFAMYGFNPNDEEAPMNEAKDGVKPLRDFDGREPYTEGWEPTYEYADMSLNFEDGGENSQPTGFAEMIRAVENAGGSAEEFNPTTDNITAEIRAGRTVIVSGTTLTNDGAAKPDDQILPGLPDYTGKHIIAVTGVTSDGDFIVCDPFNKDKTPIIVSPERLESFMSGNASAMWVDGPPPLTENYHSAGGRYIFRA